MSGALEHDLDPAAWGPLSSDALTSRFRVQQRVRGHRYSIDDQLTAHAAVHAAPQARRVLDLGAGLGSVTLCLAHALPGAIIAAVEAQAISFALLARNVAENGLTGRVHPMHGDLRETGALSALAAAHGPFDLVTGTPPYFRPGEATLPPDPQKAHARFELRGGVEAYLAAAARVLAPEGVVVICASVLQRARLEVGARTAGLGVVTLRELVPRQGKAPLFVLATLRAGYAGAVELEPPFVARDAAGERTRDERSVRAFFGLAERPA
jgi:tRNA1Val (adenine37-N6)-methyltransferase